MEIAFLVPKFSKFLESSKKTELQQFQQIIAFLTSSVREFAGRVWKVKFLAERRERVHNA